MLIHINSKIEKPFRIERDSSDFFWSKTSHGAIFHQFFHPKWLDFWSPPVAGGVRRVRRPHRPRRPLRRLRRSGGTALLRCRRLQGALQPRGPRGHHRALPGSRLHLSAPGAMRSPHPKAELGPRMVEISDANLRMEVGGNLVAKCSQKTVGWAPSGGPMPNCSGCVLFVKPSRQLNRSDQMESGSYGIKKRQSTCRVAPHSHPKRSSSKHDRRIGSMFGGTLVVPSLWTYQHVQFCGCHCGCWWCCWWSSLATVMTCYDKTSVFLCFFFKCIFHYFLWCFMMKHQELIILVFQMDVSALPPREARRLQQQRHNVGEAQKSSAIDRVSPLRALHWCRRHRTGWELVNQWVALNRIN